MAGFLYFAEGRSGMPRAAAVKLGLGSVIEDLPGDPQSRELPSGPAGKKGCIFALELPDKPRLLYLPDEQKWADGPTRAGIWVGIDKANPPRPEGLTRPRMISGHNVTLHEQEWLVALARVFPEGTLLPRALVLGEGRKLVEKPLERYISISRRAEVAWYQFLRQEGWEDVEEGAAAFKDKVLSPLEAWELAVDALALNYRVGPDEVSLLELFDTKTNREVLQALVDVPAVVDGMAILAAEELKKKEKQKPPLDNVPPVDAGGAS